VRFWPLGASSGKLVLEEKANAQSREEERKESSRPEEGGSKKKARKPNAAFMRPVTPDDVLGNVGWQEANAAHRGHQEGWWDYIRKNGLQDAKNRR
jgi:hypothetical protein